MSLEHVLLGLLREPATGYDLKAEFQAGARHFWSAELGQIYPTLEKLERRGWLKSKRQPSPKGPPRRVYRRTAKGASALKKWLKSEPILGQERFAYIAQLVFLGELNDLEQTGQFLQQLRAKLAALHGFLAGAAATTTTPDPTQMPVQELHDWIGLKLGMVSVAAKVAWCDEAIALVQSHLNQESTHAGTH